MARPTHVVRTVFLVLLCLSAATVVAADEQPAADAEPTPAADAAAGAGAAEAEVELPPLDCKPQELLERSASVLQHHAARPGGGGSSSGGQFGRLLPGFSSALRITCGESADTTSYKCRNLVAFGPAEPHIRLAAGGQNRKRRQTQDEPSQHGNNRVSVAFFSFASRRQSRDH